jgi:hypothetical protein
VRRSATMPATSGAAPDVPQPAPNPPPSWVVGVQPGAASFTQSPRLEYPARAPLSSVAPTEIVSG